MGIQDLLERLKGLPRGGITVKTIKSPSGKSYSYPFLQWTEDGVRYAQRLSEAEVPFVKAGLEEREEIEALISWIKEPPIQAETSLRYGETLASFVSSVAGWKKREGYAVLANYLQGEASGKVFVLYGLRRSGKTTLIKQAIGAMDPDAFAKTAFIQVSRNDNLAKLNKDLRALEYLGFRYVFIDEATSLPDFIEGASLLSDIYASSGMKIVLSGTDSLGFWIAKSNELYDRCIFLRTTFIPYREFQNVLGMCGIDAYIEYGGTMSYDGDRYNASVFANEENAGEYVDSSIAHNIQHSLRNYQEGAHFRHLHSLYEAGELTNAINRVIEDMNHRFTLEVLTTDFISHDLALSAKNLRADKTHPSTLLDDIDVTRFTRALMERLDIKNRAGLSVEIDATHVEEIQEYLAALDLIKPIDIVDISYPKTEHSRVVFTQPGLRYAQAKAFLSCLEEEEEFLRLDFAERKRVTERILSEIKGRMMEDIVLLETKLALPNKEVFKLQFADGEFDMVVCDPEQGGVDLYEIKYGKEAYESQARHLLDERKCALTSHRFGAILSKNVLYRGESGTHFGLTDRNVEEYLSSLGQGK